MIASTETRGLASDAAALDRAMDGAPVAIALFDRELRLVRSNERFRRLTGCPGGMPSLLALHEVFPTTLVAIGPALTAAWRGDPYPPLPVRFARGATSGTTAEVSVVRLPDALERAAGTEDALLFVATELDRVLPPMPVVSDREVARPAAQVADLPEPVAGRLGRSVATGRAPRRSVAFPPSVREPVASRRPLPRDARHDVANVLNLIASAAHLIVLKADDPDAVRRYAARIAGAIERGTEILGAGAADAARRPAPLPVAPPPATAVRRVLVVEDDESSRDLMTDILQSRGHAVRAVEGVRAAIAVLEAAEAAGAEPGFDVLLTDVGLGDGTGWDLAETVRRRWPGLRVGIVTGWDPGADPDVGADFVLRKPIRLPELLACVAGDRR